MSEHLPPFAALRAFEAVGRFGGIRSAARALHLSHAIVSRHVAGLERDLGTALFNRESATLTDAGKTYHAKLSSIFRELESATREIRGEANDKLVITCTPGLASNWLAPRLARNSAMLSFPRIILNSKRDMPDLSANSIDGDIRYVSNREELPKARAVRSIVLVCPQFFPVASVELAEKLSPYIESAADLATMPLIAESGPSEWRAWMEEQGVELSEEQKMSQYGDAQLVLAAARAGQGVALANRFLVNHDLASGNLVRVEPKVGEFREVRLGAYYFRAPSSRWTDSKLSRFHCWLSEGLSL
ncbi:MAG: LysR substrate-binding domain-containing protein [Sphingomonadaceae bacterium]|jgi:DNA-binding transcriptional LysR family regulator|uniref:LysR family transcriptional regulator n=1 Tax=Sphingorhabdus sp. TaxID=1902408 RepID=UPI0039BC682D|nr:LysR substrate-binding domain-containing protein [Sphingomonadaceae bacterium]